MAFWQHIETIIQQATNNSFSILQRRRLSGGDINQAFHISGEKCDYFIKLNTADFTEMFVREAEGLKALKATNQIRVPEVIVTGAFDNQSYLILEFLQLTPQGNIESFAKALARLHVTTNNQFGFSSNNHIGKTEQINHWYDDWGTFFSEQRIAYQLSLLGGKNLLHNSSKHADQLVKRLPVYLNQHKVRPSLVHGDLWQGNYGFDQEGEPVIYDPACYYADHEVDLAMLELFGDPGPDFFSSYQQILPIDKGYISRKKIYNLYHILNHANLFAGHYIVQAEQLIKHILREI